MKQKERFFEDFSPNEGIVHATPRTLGEGDQALYLALYGNRFAHTSSKLFAQSLGYQGRPLENWLVFHIIFGKSVPDISLNAVANLGYAEGMFFAPVYCGDTLRSASKIIGLRETSDQKRGIVYLKTTGYNQDDKKVLEYYRWVMVKKRDPSKTGQVLLPPEFSKYVAPEACFENLPVIPEGKLDGTQSGSFLAFEDYQIGEKIDHRQALTLEESEHMLATRLYQNNARLHFASHTHGEKRMIYGGHVISLARAFSFYGLENAFQVVALNAAEHLSPVFSGDTLFAWSEIVDKHGSSAREDWGVLRIQTWATKNLDCATFPKEKATPENPGVVLFMDSWVAVPKRRSFRD